MDNASDTTDDRDLVSVLEDRISGLGEILEASINEIFLFDEESLLFVLVNQGARNNLGYTMDELYGLTPVDIKPEFNNESFEEAIKPLRTGKLEKIDFLTVHVRKDGTTYPVEVHLQRSHYDAKPVFTAIILDITERAQTAEALSQARLFLESAPDATIIINGEGRVTVANSRTTDLFGYSQDELRGLSVETLLPDRFRGSHVAHRKAFIADPQPRGMGAELELFALTKSGTEIPIEISLSPIQTGDDEVLVAAAIRDVTLRKQHDEDLKLAKDQAEHATAGKSRFLAAASHDLRQPLQAIGMYLSVLGRLTDQPKQQEICDKMAKSLDTMGELLDALLDISKLDGGSVVPEQRDTSAREILDRIVTDNLQQAQAKGLTMDWTCDDCIVYTDPVLLERIIENYVTNAIRYTESGGLSLTCKVDDGVARIGVRDTGIGMPAHALDKVFNEYYQLENDMRDRRKGLGLGLAIVKHIARLLEHPLHVTSVEGEGSTFTVEVPLGKTHEIAIPSHRPLTATTCSDRVTVVLFVDDDPAVVDATFMMLDGMGLEVHTALDGNEALAHVEKGVRPDILISDYRLPGYNGVEVVRRVRKVTVNDLPSVIMTGDTSAKEIEAENLDNCTVLHKPVNTNRLIDLIDELRA